MSKSAISQLINMIAYVESGKLDSELDDVEAFVSILDNAIMLRKVDVSKTR